MTDIHMSTADCDIWSFACTGHGQMHFAPSWDTGTLLRTDLVEAHIQLLSAYIVL